MSYCVVATFRLELICKKEVEFNQYSQAVNNTTDLFLQCLNLCWRAFWKSATRASLNRRCSSCSQENLYSQNIHCATIHLLSQLLLSPVLGLNHISFLQEGRHLGTHLCKPSGNEKWLLSWSLVACSESDTGQQITCGTPYSHSIIQLIIEADLVQGQPVLILSCMVLIVQKLTCSLNS